MMSRCVKLTDASLTDGQIAVWSRAMTTGMMSRVVNRLNAAGVGTIEVMSGATVLQCLRQGQDPWQRLEVLRTQCPTARLRASIDLLTGEGQERVHVIPSDIAAKWIAELARRGLDEVVIVDPLLDRQRLAPAYDAASVRGLTATAVLPFIGDSGHPDDFFTAAAASLVLAGAGRVMLRDESGTLTPDRVETLVPRLLEATGKVPLVLHSRCTTGLGTLVAIKAIECGINELDTALPVLANGPSLPSSISLAKAFEDLMTEVTFPNRALLVAANAVLVDIADREAFPESVPWTFDLAPFVHQLPGEDAAWAMDALRVRREFHRLHEFANECAKIRKELGSPAMLAPFGRAVAEQAILNLSTEQRYEEIRPIIRRMARGAYGSPPSAIQPDMLERIGSVEDTAPTSTREEICADEPLATDEQRILNLISGLPVDRLPVSTSAKDEVYDEATPAEVLLRRLLTHSRKYSSLSLISPDISIKLNLTGASCSRD